tara:strand:+ start:4410 stop:6212 length:1803 start_codon:yes stop_codon:yes gene_type:complete
MNRIIFCQECNNQLDESGTCQKCSKSFLNKDGFFDFIQKNDEKENELKFSKLLTDISQNGYSNAIRFFTRENPDYFGDFQMMEGCIGFRAIKKSNSRCLIINSDLGNIPENLADVFDEIYSIENSKKKILIQKYRFEEKKCRNIILVRSDMMTLHFLQESFDLIIINGINGKEKNQIITNSELSIVLKNIKNLLSKNGCLCIGAENKFGLKLVRDRNNIQNYSNTLSGYKSILVSLGYNLKSYWALPSYKKPHYSGDINDMKSLNWFFKNFQRFLSKEKNFSMVDLLFKRLSGKLLKMVISFFSPSFIFYCYKNNIEFSFEDMIKKKSNTENMIQFVRIHSKKFMYILLNNEIPENILVCKHGKYDFSEDIIEINRQFPNMKNPNDKLILEKWIDGTTPNRLDSKQVELVLDWLIKFQQKSNSSYFSKQDIKEEVDLIKENLNGVREISHIPYEKWLDQFEDHIGKFNFKKTGVHGDLQPKNIFIKNDSSIEVIDWDMFVEKGNPLIDFIGFLNYVMAYSINNIEEFRSNVENRGKAREIIELIKHKMNLHFNADFDFIILLRYINLWLVSYKIKDKETNNFLTYIKYLEILSTKQDNEF